MPKGIVWTAVISAVAGAGCLTFAFLDNNTLANGFGFVSVASALLASREKQDLTFLQKSGKLCNTDTEGRK